MSYGLYVGKNHTDDGVAYLAGYGDEPSSHWLEVVPRRQYPVGATITVGVTPEADLPGYLSELPQVAETAAHICVNYTYYKGVPAPLTNGGLNEYGVAVRDIWSQSRPELVAMTPSNQTGPNYSDLARIVVERARSARHGVELIADLIATHGYSTYGGNSHLIADPDEAWIVIEFAGGCGLWVAERLGAESIRASRPGYIGEVLIDEDQNGSKPAFLYPEHFTGFAQQQGWYQPGEPFNVNQIYGDGKGPGAGATWIEQEMTQRADRAEKVGVADLIWAVRTERLTGDTAGYGQVVPLIHAEFSEVRMLWHTQVGAIAAPFVPVFMGNTSVPPEYRQHRYLTAGESARFVDTRHHEPGVRDTLSAIPQGIESTQSATQVFKRLLYLTLEHVDDYLARLTAVWEAHEGRLIESRQEVLDTAMTLLRGGRSDLACRYLTAYTNTELLHVLDMAAKLADGIEVETHALYGVSDNPIPSGAEQLW